MAKSETKASNERYRAGVVDSMKNLFAEQGEQVLQTASNKFCFPAVNDLQEDIWIEITVAMPTGSRKDNAPFDGFEQAEDYQKKQKDAAERAKKAEEAKQKKIAFDQKAREIAKKAKMEGGQ